MEASQNDRWKPTTRIVGLQKKAHTLYSKAKGLRVCVVVSNEACPGQSGAYVADWPEMLEFVRGQQISTILGPDDFDTVARRNGSSSSSYSQTPPSAPPILGHFPALAQPQESSATNRMTADDRLFTEFIQSLSGNNMGGIQQPMPLPSTSIRSENTPGLEDCGSQSTSHHGYKLAQPLSPQMESVCDGANFDSGGSDEARRKRKREQGPRNRRKMATRSQQVARF